ncbi:MAG: hypothetical protein RL370_569 [Actinomycetota bacterium]|jgi:hypothetical protein
MVEQGDYRKLNPSLMTTNRVVEDISISSFRIERLTSGTNVDWKHPLLEIFRPQGLPQSGKPSKLYLIPSRFDDEFDPDFAPEPTSARDLPELQGWSERFAHSIVEIWAGRRSPRQVEALCHHRIFSELVRQSGSQKVIGHIRKIHIQEPLDGICEATITIRYENRLRAMLVRFEGIDKRWLCTALTLL